MTGLQISVKVLRSPWCTRNRWYEVCSADATVCTVQVGSIMNASSSLCSPTIKVRLLESQTRGQALNDHMSHKVPPQSSAKGDQSRDSSKRQARLDRARGFDMDMNWASYRESDRAVVTVSRMSARDGGVAEL
jgi:hypothetical protein